MTSKELKEIKQEELTAEPSLDRMLNLKDPKTLEGLGKLAEQALKEQQA